MRRTMDTGSLNYGYWVVSRGRDTTYLVHIWSGSTPITRPGPSNKNTAVTIPSAPLLCTVPSNRLCLGAPRLRYLRLELGRVASIQRESEKGCSRKPTCSRSHRYTRSPDFGRYCGVLRLEAHTP